MLQKKKKNAEYVLTPAPGYLKAHISWEALNIHSTFYVKWKQNKQLFVL